MSFLDEYGESDLQRERFFKTIVALFLLAIAIGLVYYVFFRAWAQQWQVRSFLDALEDSRYEEAYEYWGCSVSDPCRYYSYDAFLTDWGPESEIGPVNSFELGAWYEQRTGVIIQITINGQPRNNLWVEKDSNQIGFSPY